MSDFLVSNSRLRGNIIAPPSKSQSLRALLFAAMAEGESCIKNLLPSPDIDAAIVACSQLGAEVRRSGTTCWIKGVAGIPKTPDNIVDAGNSGIILRFVAALAALNGGYTVITGDHSIRHQRPIQPLLDGLNDLGAFAVSSRNNQRPPIIIKGPLKPGIAHLDGQDSQPVSALLIASMFLAGKTEIEVTNPGETPWINITLHWLEKFNVKVVRDGFERYVIEGPVIPQAFNYEVPGDFSSALYPIVAAILTDSEITVSNLDFSDPQGDKMLLTALQHMGAVLTIDQDNKQVHVHKGGILKGTRLDIDNYIDSITLMAVVGCFAAGETHIVNGAIARAKECDRIACIVSELSKMGADIQERPDGVVVRQSELTGTKVLVHNDHRMALSLAVAGTVAKGITHIVGAECVSKTFPQFCSTMEQLQMSIRWVEAS